MNTFEGYPITSLYMSPDENVLFSQFANQSKHTSSRKIPDGIEAYEKENAAKILEQLSRKIDPEGFSHLISIPSSREWVRQYADSVSTALNVIHINPLKKIDPSKRRGPSDRTLDQNFICEEMNFNIKGIFIFDDIVAGGATIRNAIEAISKSMTTNPPISVICLFDYREYLARKGA